MLNFVKKPYANVILKWKPPNIPKYSTLVWPTLEYATVHVVCIWDPYQQYLINSTEIKPEPNMLEILLIIPSSTFQKLPIIIILFSYHYLLFPYYSLTVMFQVRIELDIQKIWYVLVCCANFSDTSKMVNEIIIAFS